VLIVSAAIDHRPLVSALYSEAYEVSVTVPAQAMRMVQDRSPDLIVFKLDGPGELALLQGLMGAGAPVCVLVAGGAAAGLLVQAALNAGAADYLLYTVETLALLPFHVRRTSEWAQARRNITALEGALVAAATATGTNEERDEALNKRICRYAHDLRTPLTYITGYSELLVSREVNPATAKQMAGEIFREAQRMNELIEQMQEFVRGSLVTPK
jgi:signal transduction histidine kinase